MNQLDKVKVWHRSKAGLTAFGLAELALAYASVSWAIDSGRLLAWFLTIVLAIGALQNFIKLAGRFVPTSVAAGPHKRSSAG